MGFVDTFAARCQKDGLGLLYAQMRRGGQIVGDFKVCTHKTRLNAMSISKSFVSAAVGIAEHEGLIQLDERICDAFPDHVPADASQYLLETTVLHLLTMTTGLASPLFFADSPERYVVKDWIDYFFHAEFDHPSGQQFLYSNFSTYMLSALIERRAGCNLLEYLRWRLFEPIGIGNPDWTVCPMGHCHAANGLYINIDELGLFGELLLRQGSWNGQQIIPATYLAKATVKQVETMPLEGSIPKTYGYGYQFWMTEIPDSYLCSGNYGQYCLILPEKDIVLAVMSFEGDRRRMIRDHLIRLAAEL